MRTFRKMTERDIEVIAKLERDIFSDAWTKQSIHETSGQSQAFITVAEEDGDVNAYCIIYHVMDEGEIARVAVDEKHRGQGVGRELLDYTCEICREKGVTRLLLDVREGNMNARNFYRKYGFVEDGIRKNFYQMPVEHAILMSKTIG